MCENIIGKPISEANYADICFYDKENDNKIIVSSEDFSSEEYPLSQFTPIGIVAVPSSHTEEKRPRIVSLAEMNYSTPDSGSITEFQTMFWGGIYYTVTNLISKTQPPYLEKNASDLTEKSVVKYDKYLVFLPSDNFIHIYVNPLNSLEGFSYNSINMPLMCSPYKEDGSKEERYFDTSNTGNVLADFDGKGNTEKILDYDNSNSTDWQTAIKISNNLEQYNHPAAQCCWRYHTDGTKQGDWYLPSEGELGYVLARISSINLAINVINTKYSTRLGIFFSDYQVSRYWSSTEYSSEIANTIDIYDGMLNHYRKDASFKVRAFLKI